MLSTRRSELDFLEKFSVVCSEFVGDGTTGRRRRVLDDPFDWFQSWADVMGTNVIRVLPTAVLAELMVLDHFLRNGEHPVWEGPSSNIIDIHAETFDCEVKFSTVRDSNIIHVSSERQLLEGDRPLHLFYCCFQESEAGVSIDDMVSLLVFHGYDRDSLEDSLDSLGFSRGKLARYSRFSLVKMWDFTVDESFPRITPASFVDGRLPLGVTSFDYTIDLTGIPHVEIDYIVGAVESDLSMYELPRKWIVGKLTKGLKTIDQMRGYSDDPMFFEIGIRDYDWPMDTRSVWSDLLDDVDSELKCNKNRCWDLFISSIDDVSISMQALRDNCDMLSDTLESRRADDRCIRMMVHSPTGMDTIDVISGLMARGADSGWNLFLVVTDNYRIGSKQVVDRICSNLSGTIDAFSWNVINSYSSDADDIDPDNLRFDGFSKSRYLLTCLRSINAVNRIYNWIQSITSKSDIRLMVIDHRSDMHMSVVSGRFPETFIVDGMIDRLTGYREDEGDDDNEFGNLSYISFVPSPFHLRMNCNYDAVNPYDVYRSIKPLRSYLGPSDMFSKDSMFLVVDDVDVDMTSFRYGGCDSVPRSLLDALSWFICSSAILQYRDSERVPCMTVLSSKNWEASTELESALNELLYNKKDCVLENCKRIYMEQSSLNGRVLDAGVSGSDMEVRIPDYEDVSATIRKLVLSADGVFIHLDDGSSVNTEYDILNGPTILINSGSMIRLTPDSIHTVSYYHRSFNSNDNTMHPGPWYGSFGPDADLVRLWMSERSASYFIGLTETECMVSDSGLESINAALYKLGKQEIAGYSKGNVLKIDGMLRCGYYHTTCDMCGCDVHPGTIHVRFDDKNVDRCLECYREHADAVMASRYGYVTDAMADAKKRLVSNGSISFDELARMSGSKRKAHNILGLLRMEGYMFRITATDVTLTWYPGLTSFLSDIGSIPCEDLYDRYRDDWRIHCDILMDMIPEGNRLKNRQECGFREHYEFFKGLDRDAISIPTGYEDISDNNDVYDEACGRVRNRVLTSLAILMFSDCSDVVPIDDDYIDVGGEVLSFSICSSVEYVPEEYDSDVILVVDDDLYLIEDYEPIPVSTCFGFGPSFERIRDYMVRLLEVGF